MGFVDAYSFEARQSQSMESSAGVVLTLVGILIVSIANLVWPEPTELKPTHGGLTTWGDTLEGIGQPTCNMAGTYKWSLTVTAGCACSLEPATRRTKRICDAVLPSQKPRCIPVMSAAGVKPRGANACWFGEITKNFGQRGNGRTRTK